ncbi:hypothetical protein [Burkholderia contaminans]|uniref:hypothetical protein n=1 Tax=Burkholderia contaminans TaxID=488447 RepID=UPI0013649C68|nr:hypothetical protein [Burkholderia contaminans]MEB4651777.1 hypothetical protein [Burkholderia contaminans]MEB4661346.1 hypothetical protein [Burkholderia contaminans]MEB4667042.1 hypothetical protein [Burkholderia contaminans]MEB4678578.1 hypothetical protein [Burkholderia contaminans]MEB4691915.1 hypothetical protein [Burkholderia contaminans]
MTAMIRGIVYFVIHCNCFSFVFCTAGKRRSRKRFAQCVSSLEPHRRAGADRRCATGHHPHAGAMRAS